ncbi:hypothetical protein HN018_22480 (plasmid) [Lichenicola cladoniae]|uniref:Uncharacterized protein n=1 Tax=Lichenicola cladoniae TaxID=1484109 RepID=A0A6M8HX83_9PROT|nr:hypothetical protein [Lichenicola cladoniae]NPD68203.1 hypothetical protein [Acetobacteraceae bacterium]QKE92978.1 hypothetical protein HN018_22480 [Lichenicola cladoniae]
MARTATSTSSSKKITPTDAAKKPRGRPPGSKNGVRATSKAKAPAAVKRAAVRKSAPAAPKLNKAELEAHVIKLERTIDRLRKQGAEMKQAAKLSTAKPAAAPVEAAVKKTRRAKAVAEAPTPIAKPRRATKKKSEMPASAADSTSESADADI